MNTPIVKIGSVKIGGGNPVAIQSMTNTDTADIQKTAEQCIELVNAGAEMVRITVDNEVSAQAISEIRKILDKKGYKHVPLIGDFHFNGHELLEKFPKCAEVLDKYRINPANVGDRKNFDQNFGKIIQIAIKNNKPIRIGVNRGSFDHKATHEEMVKTALSSAKLAEKLGLSRNKIVLSVKMSDVQEMIKAYELLFKKMMQNNRFYAVHLGLTEAGSGLKGIISSVSALSILLQKGIGDTIRISLTPDKKTPRTEEVKTCKELLQALGLRYFKPQVTSCPGCGRTNNAYFQKLASEVEKYIEKRMPQWQKLYPGIEKLRIAVMGCIVNGPGESSHADIGISLPGKNEKPVAMVYIKGKFYKTLAGNKIKEQFLKILEKEVRKSSWIS